MRGAILNGIYVAVVAITLSVAYPGQAFGQAHERFEDWCDEFRNANKTDLVQFLNHVIPDEKNSRCVTWAIHKLGKERYAPAIPALVRLLDFRRPQTPVEKIFEGFPRELYPAEEALAQMGKPALPELLPAITADSTSATARERALHLWMEAYRQSDEQPNGVARLKQEEMKTKDNSIKQRLRWAIQKALSFCNVPEQAACQEAARTGLPR
jgi:hypothetical protein